MLFRFGPVVFGLCLLLASIPVQAQLPIQSNQDPVTCENATASMQDVVVLSLHVVRLGRLEHLSFTADALTRTSEIIVDGYVNGLVVLSLSPVGVYIDQQPVALIRTNADGQYRIDHFGKMAPSLFWSTYLADGGEHIAPDQIQGRYAAFAKVPWDALSKNGEFQIVFKWNGVRYAWTVHHDTPVQLRPNNDPSEIDYLGSDLTRFKQGTAEFKERLLAIQEGIRIVETAAAVDVVEKVHLIHREGIFNAYSFKNKAEIWIYSGLFRQESLPELRSVVEHEALHILSDRLGLPGNPQVRALFAALMALAPQSREHALVMTTGYPPPRQRVAGISSRTGLLFDFINETNFIRGMSGGHARESVDEFCASFLHTLFYIDRLGLLLSQPVITHRGTLLTLSAAEQARVLADYHHALETISNEIKQLNPQQPVAAFLQAGLAATHRLGIRQVRCAEIPETPLRQPS